MRYGMREPGRQERKEESREADRQACRQAGRQGGRAGLRRWVQSSQGLDDVMMPSSSLSLTTERFRVFTRF